MSPEWIGIMISWIGLVVAFVQLRDLKKTRKGIESPFFDFTRLLCHGSNMGKMQVMSDAPSGEIPDTYPDDRPVILSARNKGGESRLTTVEALSDLEMELGWYDRISGDNDLQIHYPFKNERKGKKEKVRIKYETVSGEKGEQIFEFIHGKLDVKRLKKR